jgi:hypothetical protein
VKRFQLNLNVRAAYSDERLKLAVIVRIAAPQFSTRRSIS